MMRDECVAALNLQPGGLYLDATLGAGGHSRAILMADPTVRVVGLDCDARALAIAQERLAEFGDRFQPVRSNFSKFEPEAHGFEPASFDGVLADLGVSSMQFDTPERGFSFRHEAPLDMRMDDRQDLTAADIVNTWDETTLANTIYQYGEERLSRRIARMILQRRPWHTTTELADGISGCVPGKYRHGRIHPATRTFQALRIAVNGELDVLETFLERSPHWLAPGGRIAGISFHSLEDRILKHRLKGHELLKVITKKPLYPTEEEIRENGRSRSAKLRIAYRMEGS
ncbi:MAG: 16S rRNA (cytosine(1402)-N(4))-methyltransferase RsmH [Cyanobacteria bacterium P01_H01_bin.130]